MKKLFFLLVIIHATNVIFAQKKPLDYLSLASWPTLIPEKISNDGKYLSYTINSEISGSTLIIQSTDNSWKKEIQKASRAIFTEDSHLLIFTLPNDTIGILDLKNHDIQYIVNVDSYKISVEENAEWLAYQLKESPHDLILRNLFSATEVKYSSISNYKLSENGHILVMQRIVKKDNYYDGSIVWLNLLNGNIKKISDVISVGNFVFDIAGLQLVFITEENRKGIKSVLRYYNEEMDSTKVILNDSSLGIKEMQISNELPSFSKDGKKIFFSIQKSPNPDIKKKSDTLAEVDIWNYNDEYLQSQQLLMGSSDNKHYTAVINLNNIGKVIRLQNDKDVLIEVAQGGNGNYALVMGNNRGTYDDYIKKISYQPNIYLVSTVDGSRKLVSEHFINVNITFSLNGKYLVWYNREDKNWFSYNISSCITKRITGKIPFPLYQANARPNSTFPFEIAGWIENDSAMIIYDRFDIWLVDPNGTKSPVNITNGYGRQHHIELRYADFNAENPVPIHISDTLLLSGFNHKNKWSGFFIKSLMNRNNPTEITMGPYAYYFYPGEGALALERNRFPLLKAKYTNTYVLYRMNAVTYPNLIVTHNFKEFNSLTDLFPQRYYNWYTNELLHWKMFDGSQGEGILYKPENFDPRKKYPIIFYYYERNAGDLNLFIKPVLSNGIMNIPWFVSNGYLVFVPDIKLKTGYPCESAYNAVVSAAQYLMKKPWIDSTKMGLQGHSHGGWETNYIVTRTSLFSAAAPAAGACEIISKYNSLYDEISAHFYYERAQGSIGATLWERPDLYIQGSPIFKANKVTTPLLIMHNKNDKLVPWTTQGLAWFIALQSLGKKVWMLQYDGEGHTIRSKKNQLDYSIRLTQFFDHYLKNLPAPKWMTEGINASRKGIDSGLELDSTLVMP